MIKWKPIHLIFGQVPSKDKDHHLTKVPSKDKVTILGQVSRRTSRVSPTILGQVSRRTSRVNPPNLRSLRAFINHSVKLLQRNKTTQSIPSTLGSVKFLATTKPSHPCSRKRPIINHDQSALTILGLATIKCKAKYLLLGLSIYQELSQKTPNQPCSNCTKDKAARPHEEVKGLKPNATTRDHQSIIPLQTKGCPLTLLSLL
ncbi:unnamed protein product [Cochlearia groenlandica]